MTETEIRIGKGTVTVDSRVAGALNGKALVIDLESRKGPCDDVSCQIIRKPLARDQEKGDTAGFIAVEHGTVSLLLNREVYRSIDAGRETVTVKLARNGKFTVRGFSYIS